MKKIAAFLVIVVLSITLGIVLKRTSDLNRQIAALTNEKQSLVQDLNQRGVDLAVMKGRMVKLDEEYKKEQTKVEELVSKNSAINAENNALQEEIDTVKLERDSMQAKLVSIPELKKVIRELKRKQAQVNKILGKRSTEGKAAETGKIEEVNKIVIGNQGYIIKDGQPTFSTTVKIDVEPASVQ